MNPTNQIYNGVCDYRKFYRLNLYKFYNLYLIYNLFMQYYYALFIMNQIQWPASLWAWFCAQRRSLNLKVVVHVLFTAKDYETYVYSGRYVTPTTILRVYICLLQCISICWHSCYQQRKRAVCGTFGVWLEWPPPSPTSPFDHISPLWRVILPPPPTKPPAGH